MGRSSAPALSRRCHGPPGSADLGDIAVPAPPVTRGSRRWTAGSVGNERKQHDHHDRSDQHDAGVDEQAAAVTAIDEAKVEAFAGKIVHDLGIGHNTLLAYLGDRLGLWRAPGLPPRQHECRAGPALRLHRALRPGVAGGPGRGRLRHLRSRDAVVHAAGRARPGARRRGQPRVHGLGLRGARLGLGDRRTSWPTGTSAATGLGWHAHDSRLFVGFERFFRPAFRHLLVPEWLPSVPGLVERLRVGRPRARRRLRPGHRHHRDGRGVPRLDVRRRRLPPRSRCAGPAARRRMPACSDRVTFRVARGAVLRRDSYDLICMFDTLHDLGDPVGVAEATRSGTWPTAGGSSPSSPTPATASRRTSTRSV